MTNELGSSIRTVGTRTLSTVLKEPINIKILERYIYRFARSHGDYLYIVYEVIGDLCSEPITKQTLQTIIQRLHSNSIRWCHPSYNIYRDKILEEEQLLSEPIEIEEGVLECKCGSKRTISFQRQTRSADEGSTTFAQCVQCGTRWKHHN